VIADDSITCLRGILQHQPGQSFVERRRVVPCHLFFGRACLVNVQPKRNTMRRWRLTPLGQGNKTEMILHAMNDLNVFKSRSLNVFSYTLSLARNVVDFEGCFHYS